VLFDKFSDFFLPVEDFLRRNFFVPVEDCEMFFAMFAPWFILKI